MFEILAGFEDKPLTLPAIPSSFIKVAIKDENSKNFDNRIHLQSKTTLPLAASEVLQSGLKKSRKLAGGDDVKTVYEVFLDVGVRFFSGFKVILVFIAQIFSRTQVTNFCLVTPLAL